MSSEPLFLNTSFPSAVSVNNKPDQGQCIVDNYFYITIFFWENQLHLCDNIDEVMMHWTFKSSFNAQSLNNILK